MAGPETGIQLKTTLDRVPDTIHRTPIATGSRPSMPFICRCFPKLRLLPSSRLATELLGQVIAGELHLAIVTAPPKNGNITSSRFACHPLNVALPAKLQKSG